MFNKKLERSSYLGSTLEISEKILESALLLLRLEQQNVELIYIDEFSVNTRHN